MGPVAVATALRASSTFLYFSAQRTSAVLVPLWIGVTNSATVCRNAWDAGTAERLSDLIGTALSEANVRMLNASIQSLDPEYDQQDSPMAFLPVFPRERTDYFASFVNNLFSFCRRVLVSGFGSRGSRLAESGSEFDIWESVSKRAVVPNRKSGGADQGTTENPLRERTARLCLEWIVLLSDEIKIRLGDNRYAETLSVYDQALAALLVSLSLSSPKSVPNWSPAVAEQAHDLASGTILGCTIGRSHCSCGEHSGGFFLDQSQGGGISHNPCRVRGRMCAGCMVSTSYSFYPYLSLRRDAFINLGARNSQSGSWTSCETSQ